MISHNSPGPRLTPPVHRIMGADRQLLEAGITGQPTTKAYGDHDWAPRARRLTTYRAACDTYICRYAWRRHVSEVRRDGRLVCTSDHEYLAYISRTPIPTKTERPHTHAHTHTQLKLSWKQRQSPGNTVGHGLPHRPKLFKVHMFAVMHSNRRRSIRREMRIGRYAIGLPSRMRPSPAAVPFTMWMWR